MFQLETRRGFLATLIKGGAALTLPYQLFAQERISSTKIADNFAQVTGAGGNILVISGPDGLLLVDGAAPERSADLMKFIGDQFKNQRIQALFNTDWHPEHTGSNEAIRKTGAKIIAHENTKLWLGGDFGVCAKAAGSMKPNMRARTMFKRCLRVRGRVPTCLDKRSR